MSRKKRGWKGNSIPAAPTAAASEGSRTISMTGNQGLFFSSEGNNREFSSVLREVQEFISSSHADLIISGGDGEARAQIKRYAAKYIRDNRIAVTVHDANRQRLAVPAVHRHILRHLRLPR